MYSLFSALTYGKVKQISFMSMSYLLFENVGNQVETLGRGLGWKREWQSRWRPHPHCWFSFFPRSRTMAWASYWIEIKSNHKMTFSFIKASFRIFLKSNQELVFKFEMSYEMLRLISPYRNEHWHLSSDTLSFVVEKLELSNYDCCPLLNKMCSDLWTSFPGM